MKETESFKVLSKEKIGKQKLEEENKKKEEIINKQKEEKMKFEKIKEKEFNKIDKYNKIDNSFKISITESRRR